MCSLPLLQNSGGGELFYTPNCFFKLEAMCNVILSGSSLFIC